MTSIHYYQKSCANVRASKWHIALLMKALVCDNLILLLKSTSRKGG